jgi:hypothetical protein
VDPTSWVPRRHLMTETFEKYCFNQNEVKENVKIKKIKK